MAINFPSTPTDGQIYTNPVNGVVYTYSNTSSAWEISFNPVGLSVSIDSFTANGTQNTFITNIDVGTSNSAIVTVNGLVMTPVVDYTFSANTLNMMFTPVSGSEIEVKYLGAIAATSEASIAINKVFFYSTIIGG